MWWTIIIIFAVIIIGKQLLSHNISIQQASDKLAQDAMLVDVRTNGEFVSGHLPQAVNIPLDEIEKIYDKVKDKSATILLYCHSGARAAAACAKLRRLGYSDVSNVGSYSRTRRIVKIG